MAIIYFCMKGRVMMDDRDFTVVEKIFKESDCTYFI